MIVMERRAGVGARSPAFFIFQMRFFCQLVLVGDHCSQFQLQQNTGEDGAGIVMHDDAVVIAVLDS